jgi:NAD(P)-dependent dehydrogenase (short-subunit alcohol dehydrogenase family)
MAPSWTPDSLPALSGRVYLVTGGNAGIGFHTVLQLAKHGARVYLGSRSAEKGNQAMNSIKASVPKADIALLQMDLMDLSSVVAAAKNLLANETQLHGLVNSAGIMATPFQMTKDGYESQWETNYLSHWVLAWHLLPLMQKTAINSPEGAVRIVNVSSIGHSSAPSEGINFADTSLKDSHTFRRYGQSKLGNILHAKALDKRYGPASQSENEGGKIWIVALHPGNVDTGLNQKSWGSAMVPVLRCLGVYIKPEEGAYTSLFAVAGESLRKEDSGKYFVPFGKLATPSKMAQNMELAERLWDWTEKEMREKKLIQ